MLTKHRCNEGASHINAPAATLSKPSNMRSYTEVGITAKCVCARGLFQSLEPYITRRQVEHVSAVTSWSVHPSQLASTSWTYIVF